MRCQNVRRWFSGFTIFLWILTSFSPESRAQQARFRFERISILEGLSQSAVYSITQDNRGFLWICTQGGLNRYDGYNFTHYKFNPYDQNSLSDNFTLVAYEDRDKNLWVGTNTGGLNCFDSSRTHNIRYKADTSDIYAISDNIIYSIAEGQDGNLWIGTADGGVNYFNKATRRFINFNNNRNLERLRGANVISLQISRDGMVWAGTSEGLYIINPADFSCRPFMIRRAGEVVQSLCLSDDNKYLLAGMGNDTLVRIHLAKKSVEVFALGEFFRDWAYGDFVQAITPASNGYYWVATAVNGLIRANFDEVILIQSKNDPARNYSISNNEVYCVFKDRSGIIWVGTGLGLNKLDRQNERFKLIQNETESGVDPSFNNIYAFCEDSKGRLWVGSKHGGLCLYDRKKETLIKYSSGNENVSAIVEDHQGNLWVGQITGGIYKLMNPEKPNSRRVAYRANMRDTNSLMSNDVTSIMVDKRGYLWISTYNRGISILNPYTNRFNNILYRESQENGLRVLFCYQDSYGKVWIGTMTGGLHCYNVEKSTYVTYQNNPRDSTTLSHNNVTSVYEDSKRRLWVCTAGGGLNLLDRRTGKFTRFTEKDGLPSDNMYGILEDNRGNLWISTNNGISKFNPYTRTFKNYDITDNLQNREYNQGAFLKTKDGTFFFGGITGFNTFKPQDVIDNPYIAPVMITAFRKFDRTLTEFIPEGHTIELSYKENFFSFEFVLLNFTKTSKNTYAYKLEGFDEDWVNCGTRRYASYTNLQPGEYTFKVKGANNDGVWNEKGTSVRIIIKPLFWQTLWFKILVVLGAILILAIAIYYTLNDIRKKSELKFKNELTELQLKALRAQMNPHFIFNSLNSIQQFIASSERKQALIYLSKFAKLIRQILENSSRNYVSVENELRTLELYVEMEKLRFENKFEYHFEIDPKIDQQSTEVPSLLIQPYIENAILHGLVARDDSGGQLLVMLKKTDKSLLCVVQDNGVGRARAQEIKERKETGYKSMGMSVTHERLEILNQHMHNATSVNIIDLLDDEGKPAGTRVEINIPIENQ